MLRAQLPQHAKGADRPLVIERDEGVVEHERWPPLLREQADKREPGCHVHLVEVSPSDSVRASTQPSRSPDHTLIASVSSSARTCA